MHLHVSSRVAAKLLLNLVKPKLSPIAEAAAKHEQKVRTLIVQSAQQARDAVPMGELEHLLGMGHPGTGGPVYLLEEALKAWAKAMLGDGVEPAPTDWIKMRHAAANKKDLPSVLKGALDAGAEATEVCAIDSIQNYAFPAPETTSKTFFYHMTPRENLTSIAKSGLIASDAGGVSLAANIDTAIWWSSQLGKNEPVLLRVRRSKVPKSSLTDVEFTAEVATDKSIKASALEIFHMGRWKLLSEVTK